MADNNVAQHGGAVNETKGGIGALAAVLLTLLGLVVGALLGMFVLKGIVKANPSALAGKTTLTEAELDNAVASFVYNGEQTDISARDAILSASSLEASKTEDGNYSLPAADAVLSFARNAILAKDVEAHGIKVSESDITAYAEEYMGTSDYSSIASQYGMDEDQVKKTLEQSCATRKLYEEVVDQPDSTMPDAPTTPEEGKEGEATAEYGAYIVELLGDEWDSANNKWAREDGPFYEALGTETFSADSATYSQAESAYYVAYSQYSQQSSNASAAWTEYVNGLLSNASVNIFSLVS
ncbi:MAG: hypothetical protein IJ125_05155 [Atopobiaceae bacterium]|nr:hypothetical protein [Atopobiaceae bacterium]